MIPTETRERFIRDLAAQLPAAGIIEAHFFAPRRVGGIESGVAVVAASTEPVSASPDRYTVFSATYRHTLKGTDRGKWEVTVKAEADAPLVTVDQVVRGVQRRAEDTDEVERMTGEEIRALVGAPDPADAP
ncbi:MAG: hypothetical protein KGN74_14585 [Gemmatimonadota bacterium]|nr:hypothetical protein [Gemmatimonadota bacterium]